MKKTNNSIFSVIRRGDGKKLLELLKNPTELQRHNSYGYSPLSYAIGLSKQRMVKIIAANNHYINSKNLNTDYTALHIAVIYNDIEALEILLKNKIDANLQDRNGETGLTLAALHGHTQMARVLLQYNSNPSIKNFTNNNALSIAIAKENTNLVKLLLNPFNQKDEKFFIYYSKTGKKAHLSDILIAKKPLFHIENYKGDQPIHSAAEINHFDLIDIILAQIHKGKKNQKNRFGYTALHVAAENGHLQSVKRLSIDNFSLNKKNLQGDTPALTAIKNNHQNVLSFLLSQNIEINAQDKQGNSILHYAVQDSSVELIKIILKKKAKAESKGFCEATPIHYAVIRNDPEIINLLLASLNKYPNFNLLNFAAEFDHQNILRYLLKDRIFSVQNQNCQSISPDLVRCNKSNVFEIFKTKFFCFYEKKEGPNKLTSSTAETNNSFSLASYSLDDKKLKIVNSFLKRLTYYCRAHETMVNEVKDTQLIENPSPIFFYPSNRSSVKINI